MRNTELTVDVDVRMSVPYETVERCLAILEMWMNDNPDKIIVGEEDISGRKRLRVEKFNDPSASD